MSGGTCLTQKRKDAKKLWQGATTGRAVIMDANSPAVGANLRHTQFPKRVAFVD
jgi:hypothetical protein